MLSCLLLADSRASFGEGASVASRGGERELPSDVRQAVRTVQEARQKMASRVPGLEPLARELRRSERLLVTLVEAADSGARREAVAGLSDHADRIRVARSRAASSPRAAEKLALLDERLDVLLRDLVSVVSEPGADAQRALARSLLNELRIQSARRWNRRRLEPARTMAPVVPRPEPSARALESAGEAPASSPAPTGDAP